MANSYNSNPILINTDTAAGWRSLQTLNTGNFPATAQGPNPTYRQPGIRPYRVQLVATGATSAGTVTVNDPNDSTLLWQSAVAASVVAGTIIIDEAVGNPNFFWRDFKVTGVTATATQLQIFYR